MKHHNTVHGESKNNRTRLYTIWVSMKSRCNNVNSKDYKNYGARGISVCDDWSDSYVKFKSWSIYNGYNDLLCLDRVDNGGNYDPSNCRWVTNKDNSRNTRQNVNVTYNGKTQCVSAWAEEVGLEIKTLQYRIRKGWDIGRALTTPSLIDRKGGGSND